jgi:hypothetical protein
MSDGDAFFVFLQIGCKWFVDSSLGIGLHGAGCVLARAVLNGGVDGMVEG